MFKIKICPYLLTTGDVLLEVNGFSVRKQEDARPFLSGRLRRLAISIIPTGRRKEYTRVLKKNVQAQNQNVEWGRVKRAKSLHDRVRTQPMVQ